MPVEKYCRDDVLNERRIVPGPLGPPDIPVIIYRPVKIQGPIPALLHIHGGGLVPGSAEGTSNGPGEAACPVCAKGL